MSDAADEFPEGNPTKCTIYADDIKLYEEGTDLQEMARHLQIGVNKLLEWAHRNQLSFNASKTKMMIFTRKKEHEKPVIKIGEETIEYVNEFKYLGITFDTELKWDAHIKKQTKRATASLMIGRRMVGKLWGLNPTTTDWLYKAIIRPIITYGAIVWASSLKRQKTKKQLTKIQRLACTMITGAMRSTPTAGMEILLGLPPLDIYIKAQAQLSSIRLIRMNHWNLEPGRKPPKGSHVEILNNMRLENTLLTYPQDKLPGKQTIPKKHTTTIGTRENFTPKDDTNIQSNEIVCYTDGSKTDDGSGCAYIIKTKDYDIQEYTHLGKLATVFQAEITAITQASMALNNLETSRKEITNYIDSQSAIKALNTHFTTQKTVKECKEQLTKLQQKSNQITLHWIPAHKAI